MLICLLPCFAMIHKIGGYDTPNEAYSVKVIGNLAYVANGFTGLLIFDVSNPHNPQLVGQSVEVNHAREVVVAGNYAYVSCQEPGLLIFDISNPQSPQIVGSYNAPHTANSVDVVGNLAYLADYESGLLIVDVSNPQSPQLLGSYDTPNYADVVKVVNNVAYIADESGGLIVVNVSNPQNPQLLGAYNIGWSCDLSISDGNLYVLSDTSLKVYDISNPQSLQLLDSIDLPEYPSNINVEAGKAYVSFLSGDLDYAGLQMIDVTDPQNMQLMDVYETASHQYARSCDVVGNLIYLASGGSGLQVLERTGIANPALLGIFDTPDYANAFEFSNGFVYLAGTSGLQCIDVSNPQNPCLIWSFSPDGEGNDIDLENNLAYVTSYSGSLQIIDISIPQTPALVGSYGDSLYANQTVVSGGKAYICGWDLQIVDVSNPQNPQLLGSLSFDWGWLSRVAVQGDIAYAIVSYDSGNSNLYTIDISDAQNPQILGNYSASTFISSIAVAGENAYISLGMEGLQVINVANPNAPVLVSTILPRPSSSIHSVYIKDNLMFVTDNAWNEIDVFYLATGLSPSLLHQYSWNLETHRMFYNNGILYTTNGYNGLNILDYNAFVHNINPLLPTPQSIFITNYPNPFNLSTTIKFENQTAGTVHLEIYNTKGQRVKSLLNEHRLPALYEIGWDGKDDNGKAISSGVYYARISLNGRHSVKKIVLIK